MAVLVESNPTGLTDEENISTANSGGAIGNAFDEAVVGTTGEAKFDTARAILGTGSWRLGMGTTAAQTYIGWDATLSNFSTMYFRAYVYMAANPADTTRLFLVRKSGAQASCRILSNGTVGLYDAAGTRRYESTAALPLNQWCRIEWHLVGSSTVGKMMARLYYGVNLHGSTPSETIGNLTDNWNTSGVGDWDAIRIGATTDSANSTFWIDAIKVRDDAWVGSAITGGTADSGLAALSDVTQSADGATTLPNYSVVDIGTGSVPANASGTAYTSRRLTVSVDGLLDENVDIALKGTATNGTVVMFSGTLGTTFWSGGSGTVETWVENELVQKGYQVIQAKWITGWQVSDTGVATGFIALSRRVYALLKYLHDTYAGTKDFIVTGNSGGSSQTIYPLAFYDGDTFIDVAIPTAGSPHGAIDKGVFGPASYQYDASALGGIDLAYGGPEGTGPASTADTAFTEKFQIDSVANAWNTNWAAKTKFLHDPADNPIVAMVDDIFASLTGDYIRQRITGAGHPMHQSATARAAISETILGRPQIIQQVSSTPTVATSAAVTLTYATSVGTMLIAMVGALDPTITPPAGWTLLGGHTAGTSNRVAIYYKIATGSETTLTFNIATSKRVTLVVMEVDVVTEVNISGVGADTGGTATALTLNAATALTKHPAFVVAAMSAGATNAGWLNTWTNSFIQRYAHTDQLTVATLVPSVSGTTPSTTETWSPAKGVTGVIGAFSPPSIPDYTGEAANSLAALGNITQDASGTHVEFEYENTAEGGTDETTVSAANSGGASGNAFSTVDKHADATLVFDTQRAAHGSYSFRITTGGVTAAYARMRWNFVSKSEIYVRFYLYFVNFTGSTTRIGVPVGGTGNLCSIRLLNDGKLALYDNSGSGGTRRYESTNPIPLNQWVRVEARLVFSNTVGHMEAKYFSGHGTTPIQTIGNMTDNWDTGAAATGFVIGLDNALLNAEFWTDEVKVRDDAYIGPATTIPPRNASGDSELSSLAAITTDASGIVIDPDWEGIADSVLPALGSITQDATGSSDTIYEGTASSTLKPVDASDLYYDIYYDSYLGNLGLQSAAQGTVGGPSPIGGPAESTLGALADIVTTGTGYWVPEDFFGLGESTLDALGGLVADLSGVFIASNPVGTISSTLEAMGDIYYDVYYDRYFSGLAQDAIGTLQKFVRGPADSTLGSLAAITQTVTATSIPRAGAIQSNLNPLGALQQHATNQLGPLDPGYVDIVVPVDNQHFNLVVPEDLGKFNLLVPDSNGHYSIIGPSESQKFSVLITIPQEVDLLITDANEVEI